MAKIYGATSYTINFSPFYEFKIRIFRWNWRKVEPPDAQDASFSFPLVLFLHPPSLVTHLTSPNLVNRLCDREGAVAALLSSSESLRTTCFNHHFPLIILSNFSPHALLWAQPRILTSPSLSPAIYTSLSRREEVGKESTKSTHCWLPSVSHRVFENGRHADSSRARQELFSDVLRHRCLSCAAVIGHSFQRIVFRELMIQSRKIRSKFRLQIMSGVIRSLARPNK